MCIRRVACTHQNIRARQGDMEEIHSWFEVPAIAHYFHTFRKAFDLTDFDIEELEEALLFDSPTNVSSFLPDLVIRLLCGLYKTKDGLQVTLENYNHYLKDLLSFHYVTQQQRENPVEEKEFRELSARQKVELLFDMCNWRLELEDAMELTKNIDGSDMRVEALGKDGEGSIYWYFTGTRLYKESFRVRACEERDNTNKMKKKQTKHGKRKLQTKSGRKVKKRKTLDYKPQDSGEDSDVSSVKSEEKGDSLKLKLNLSKNTWELVCSTLTEWEDLVAKFKGSRGKNEKELSNSLSNVFEQIPQLFEKRERAIQKKLLMMAPRRASNRISLKMQQKESAERLLEQEQILKQEQKLKEAEERQKQLEKQKVEEREKRYKQREKLLEERAQRARQREEQKLIAENPELVKTLITNSDNVINASSLNSLSEKEDESIYRIMSRIMTILREDEDSWPFVEPVKEEDAPHYYEYIKKPMDFQKIEGKIERREYENEKQFKEDMMLIFENCEMYNGTHSTFTKLAKILKKVFLKLMKQEFPPEVPIKDEDFLETSTQNKRQKTSKKSKKLDRTDNMNLQKAKDKTEKELCFQPWNVAKPKSSDCVTYLSQNKTGTVSSSNVQLPTVYKDRLIQISCAPTAQTGLKHPRKYITPAQIQKLFAQNHTSMAGISLSSNTVVLHSQPLAVKKGNGIAHSQFLRPSAEKVLLNKIIPSQSSVIGTPSNKGQSHTFLIKSANQTNLKDSSAVEKQDLIRKSVQVQEGSSCIKPLTKTGTWITQAMTNMVSKSSSMKETEDLIKIPPPLAVATPPPPYYTDGVSYLAANGISLTVDATNLEAEQIPPLRPVKVGNDGQIKSSFFSQKLPPSTTISATAPGVSSADVISISRSVSFVNQTQSNCDSLPSTDKNKVENWLMLSANYLSLPKESKSELKIGNPSSSPNISNVGLVIGSTLKTLTQSQSFKTGVVMKQVNANSQVVQERGTSEPSLQELHKAARQALAVNQIQTKLQTHLKEKQTTGPPGMVLPSEVLKKVSVANQSNGPLEQNMVPSVFDFKVNGFLDVAKPNTMTKFSEGIGSSAAITHNKAKMNLQTQVVHNISLPNLVSSSGKHNSISKHSKIVFKDGSDVKSHVTLSRSITVGSSMTLTDKKPSRNNDLQINKIRITSGVPLVSHAIQGIQTASKITAPPTKYVLRQGVDAKGQKVHYLIPASALLIGDQQSNVIDQPKKSSELHRDNVKGTFKTQTKQIMNPNHGTTFLSKKMAVETSIVGNIQNRPLLHNFHQYPPYSSNNPIQGNCSSGDTKKITDTKSHLAVKTLDIGTTASSLSVVSTVTPKVSTVLVTNTLNMKTPGAKNLLVSPMRLLNQGINFAKSMNPANLLPPQSENKHSVHSTLNQTLKLEVNNQLQTAQGQTALNMSNHISKPLYSQNLTDPSSLHLPGAAGKKGVVLNQAQFLQYHRDGKILVTSSGELLLMTSNQ